MREFGDDARAAIDKSFLGRLPSAAADQLLAGAELVRRAPGTVMYDEGGACGVAIVVHGLLRVFMTSLSGRQVTVRYVRPGDAMGIWTVYVGMTPLGVMALTDASLLRCRPEVWRDAADTNVEVAGAFLVETSGLMAHMVNEIGGAAFGSTRERVARHLLRAAESPAGNGQLVASLSQQELADGVASVREVVAATLAEFRDAGLVATHRGRIVIRDPQKLHAIAFDGE